MSQSLQTLMQPPPTPPLLTQPHTAHSSFCFHLEHGSCHPQAGVTLTQLHTWNAEVSLGGSELSAQSPAEEGLPKTYQILGAGTEALDQSQ